MFISPNCEPELMVLLSHHSRFTVLTGELTEPLPHCPQVVYLALYLDICDYFIEVKAIQSAHGRQARAAVRANIRIVTRLGICSKRQVQEHVL